MVKVILTGASGFIAQHIVNELFTCGYEVVGTVRSEAKGDHLKLLFGDKFDYEIVKDIVTDGAFDEVLKKHTDAQYFIHSASPFHYDTTDPEKDLIIPAIKGTENALKSIKQYGGQIKKVVVTSSDAAVYTSTDEQDGSKYFDETSWNEITYEDACKDAVEAYYGAKSFAEKRAWKFMEEDKPNFKLTCVLPVYVFGPQFDPKAAKSDKLNTSNQVILDIVKVKDYDALEKYKGGYVDVRDVAKTHVLSLTNDDTTGERLFLFAGKFSTQMILDCINDNFPQLELPKGTVGSGPADISTLCKSNNDKTRKIIGFEFNSFENTIVDTVKQFFA